MTARIGREPTRREISATLCCKLARFTSIHGSYDESRTGASGRPLAAGVRPRPSAGSAIPVVSIDLRLIFIGASSLPRVPVVFHNSADILHVSLDISPARD